MTKVSAIATIVMPMGGALSFRHVAESLQMVTNASVKTLKPIQINSGAEKTL